MPETTTTPQEVVRTYTLKVSGQLPGEETVKAVLEYARVARETMDKDVQKRWDTLGVQIAEDSYSVWRGIWVEFGLLK